MQHDQPYLSAWVGVVMAITLKQRLSSGFARNVMNVTFNRTVVQAPMRDGENALLLAVIFVLGCVAIASLGVVSW